MNKQSYSAGSFLSADGESQVAYYLFDNVQNPKGIVQISHGMQEHIGRYEKFASILNEKGYIVVGNDHLGHGKTSLGADSDGFFAKKNGDKCVLADLRQMTLIIEEKYPTLPLFLFGHSMGSFFARLYASVYSDINGYIFCGTSGKVKFQRLGLSVLRMLKLFKGQKAHSAFAKKLMVKSYFKYIPNFESPVDWITADKNAMENYLKDERTKINFTLGAYTDMLKTLIKVNKSSWAKKLNKKTPILLVSGAQDPVGQYGTGVCQVYKMLEKQKIEKIDLRLYACGRHEPHNEVKEIRESFYKDLTFWLDKNVAQSKND